MKKILFLTGTRADFGKLKPLIYEVERSREFECHIFATGMHTLNRYGATVHEIRKSGFRNIFPYINQIDSNIPMMDITLANTLQGLGHYVREFPPDMIVVHGDRVETLAGAIVGALNNILVSHVEGGELSGTVDELIRHAVSKLAHLHFVANVEAKRRLIQMGEAAQSVFTIGSPDVDAMLSKKMPSLNAVQKRYRIPFNKYGIFIYHPVTTEVEMIQRNVRSAISALEESCWNFVIIHPNNDHGSSLISTELNRLKNNSQFKIFPSLRFEHFLTLLKHARVIVGNSSAGVREAPIYGVPTINIGSRQMNRYNYVSIVNVQESKSAILAALKQIPNRYKPSRHFGGGESAKRFIREILQPKIWKTALQKQFIDFSNIKN